MNALFLLIVYKVIGENMVIAFFLKIIINVLIIVFYLNMNQIVMRFVLIIFTLMKILKNIYARKAMNVQILIVN